MIRLSRRLLKSGVQDFAEQYGSTGSNLKGGPTKELTAFQLSIARDKCGALLEPLKILEKYRVNCTHISSRLTPLETQGEYISLFFDIPHKATDDNVVQAFKELEERVPHMSVIGSWTIPWYPTCLQDLDRLDQSTLSAGAELVDDPNDPHPGFHDEAYKKQRRDIAAAAAEYKHGQKIVPAKYSTSDVETWGTVWEKLTKLYPTHACREYNHVFPLLVENAGYRRNRIPDLQQVSDYLQDTTGFTIRPVSGLLSSRDFLNALAFRCFFSTQYIRHPSKPLYTPEPDVVHELMGHVPLFANPDFADFTQQIGLMSLGASDENIEKLARCYWYTVEFGLCKEGNQKRVCGAGLLSSFGEMQHSLSGKCEYKDWDPFVAITHPLIITSYQPVYFVAQSFQNMTEKLSAFARSLDPPFEVQYNNSSGKVRTFAKHHKW